MKGIAINILFAIIISIFVFLSALGIYNWMLMQNEKLYCYNMYRAYFINIPDECKRYISSLEKAYLNYSLESTEEAISIYIARCWVRTNRGGIKNNISCFSIEIANESTYSLHLNFTRVKEYVKKYSDVPLDLVVIRACNTDLCPVNKTKVLIVAYNGSHIIVW
ncbi:MAG: hypothetical protein BXU00_03040 [Candidatus Nanoclepta minutus]|uniref:Uncharacterized protein n=1 Tax=Candidatus Nanoclepta minutus TaxID=1940235 RepID=A0A397WNQ7_9ARCH|nr:MAG: hypothetical protein BXU00_03040 [Candidatus Nanoclepta minutus]